MLELTLSEFAILLSISLLSISLSVQIQNRVRSTIAVTISILICTLTLAVGYLGFSSLQNPFSQITEEILAPTEMEPSETLELTKNENNSVRSEFIQTFTSLLQDHREQAEESLSKLQNLPLLQISELDDYSFEQLQKNSLALSRSLSQNYKDVHVLKAPTPELKASSKTLQQALFQLKSSAQAVRAFLSASTDIQEKQALQKYQKNLAQGENLLESLSF